MTSSVSLQASSSGDALDGATGHLRALAALLMRFFEALAALRADRMAAADVSGGYEPEVWTGLQHVMADVLRTAGEIQQLTDGLRLPPAELAASSPDVDGESDAPSIAGLACEIARDALNVDLGTIIEDHQDDWAALVHAVRDEKFHGSNGARDAVEPLELYSKVITTLPVELRRDFRRLTEWRTADQIAERQAAFELGRQIERHARVSRR